MIGSTISWLLNLYWYFILARILISWFPDVNDTAIGRFIIRVTEPYLAPFRRFIPAVRLGSVYLDLSVIVAIFAFYFIENGLLWIVESILQLFGLS
ncbi:YggT family protein [Sulfoacidibacillus thermotolerans]|uniref:YggT family protein n=1 Tax=Sulfoacidibacillus thermotolerans TaxID=1765684 RepID=UPI001FE2EED2|nr:YggT family protein [Sulfoacidibacillus thermotolerans]